MIRDFEDNVILDVLVDVFLPCGRYTESLMLMSLLEVCQEWGGQKRSYVEDIEGSCYEA